MWSCVVVVLEPVWQGSAAVVVGSVDEPVGPFACHGLVEAFDLAVGAWPVGLCFEVSDAVVCEEPADLVAADVGPGVVGHQSLGGDAVVAVEGEGALEEADDRRCLLVVVDLGVGEPTVVVDDRVHDVDAVAVLAVLA